jgi:hypothetical protein
MRITASLVVALMVSLYGVGFAASPTPFTGPEIQDATVQVEVAPMGTLWHETTDINLTVLDNAAWFGKCVPMYLVGNYPILVEISVEKEDSWPDTLYLGIIFSAEDLSAFEGLPEAIEGSGLRRLSFEGFVPPRPLHPSDAYYFGLDEFSVDCAGNGNFLAPHPNSGKWPDDFPLTYYSVAAGTLCKKLTCNNLYFVRAGVGEGDDPDIVPLPTPSPIDPDEPLPTVIVKYTMSLMD